MGAEAPAERGSIDGGGTLAGKVALVTGSSGGIGAAIVSGLAAEGARVVALDLRDGGRGEPEDGEVLRLTGDVTREDEIARCLEIAEERLGPVDILCNNAAILGAGSLAEMTTETWDRVIAVDLTSVFLMCRAVIPGMVERGGGVIVNTASAAAFVGGGGDAAYTAAKHGVVGLTRQVAVEYGSRGVRCNAVCPGPTETPMTEPFRSGADTSFDSFIASIPAGRWARPAEIAGVVCFLAGPGAAFAHGASWCVDGGWTSF